MRGGQSLAAPTLSRSKNFLANMVLAVHGVASSDGLMGHNSRPQVGQPRLLWAALESTTPWAGFGLSS